jgi:hypothetical protein
MPVNIAVKANTINQAINQNWRKAREDGAGGGGSGVVSIDYGTAIEYAESIVAGQVIAITDGKAYNPSVVFSAGKPGAAIATISGDAGTVGYYKKTLQVVCASGSEGALYLSTTLPYYNDTPMYADGAVWQVVGRQVGATVAVLECESSAEIEYEPFEGD